MAQKAYDDFTPQSEILEEKDATVIRVGLPGFKKGEVKVTLRLGANPKKIRISGERPIVGNIWRRFRTDFPIPPDCDADGTTAKLDGFILTLTLPKKTANAQKPDERKETKESGQEQQAKGQTNVVSPQPKPDHQKPTNGGSDDQAFQETKNKRNTEEPAAPQLIKGKASVSEDVLPKPLEEPKSQQAKGQTNGTSLASPKVDVAPPEPKPDHQKPNNGDGKETREEASPEAVRGGGSSDPPPQPHQESNKKAEEQQESGKPANPQVNGKKAASEEAPKPEEPKSQTQQAIPTEVKDKKEGTTSKTTADNRSKEEGDTRNTAKRATAAGYECTFAEVKLRRHRRKMTNLALMVLAGIGIGLYVKNMIRSYGWEAED